MRGEMGLFSQDYYVALSSFGDFVMSGLIVLPMLRPGQVDHCVGRIFGHKAQVQRLYLLRPHPQDRWLGFQIRIPS
jgi:hypothetical protein